MKKIFGAFALIAITLCTVTETKAQMYYNGKNVQFKFPRGIDSSKTYLFPTWKYVDQTWKDTFAITTYDFETYAHMDTIKGTTKVILTPSAYLLPGAKFYLDLKASNDSARTVYVKQGAYNLDTVTVSNTVKRWYVFDGNKYQVIK